MSDETHATRRCILQRAAGAQVAPQANRLFETWPGNIECTAPLTFNPTTLAELANAVLKAENTGHHVRAYGSKWSFSDAVCATTGNRPGAMIATEHLNKSLGGELTSILAAGVSPTLLCYVQAGIGS